MRFYLAADPGSTHGGHVDRAEALIDAAARSGYDGIKFQFFQAQAGSSNIAIDLGFAQRLSEHAVEAGIDFFASVWDLRGLEALKNCYTVVKSGVGGNIKKRCVSQIKFAHSQRYSKLIPTACANFDRVYISMDLTDAVTKNYNHPSIVRVYCVPEYPPRYKILLHGIPQWFEGYSDHTLTTDTASIAVKAGAWYIESHIRLDSRIGVPDEAIARCPSQQLDYVNELRSVYDSLIRVGRSDGKTVPYRAGEIGTEMPVG